MKPTIKMLEERIHKVVERMKTLTQERDELRSRLHDLEQRTTLEELPAVNLPARLAELENALQDAVRELRHD